ncbi:hypothetical protein [Halorientalis regularis]|jgi:hypothetical protein|uniref:Uncharacterized protein n=1 Tax=Halorientalis regularis TaxID=660518 RepID=A0A1G7MDU4_9EURY|nr:hypothetical protein [Halorientalis regularis]SDF59977.1 hypothetical protein SAMN05216218_107235 [Halorientalis regularis]
MSEGVTTASSVRNVDGVTERAMHWLVLGGNRIAVAGVLVGVIVAVFFLLTRFGVLAIGPGSAAASAFASGLISGTVTLVTIALSINQLVLSRVFGSPNELSDQLGGTRDLRRTVRDHAGEPAVPNDPAEFLNLVAETLTERANHLGSAVDDADGDRSHAVTDYAEGIAAYGESIAERIESQTAIVNVLAVVLGTEYAQNMTATEHFRNEYGDRLSDDASAELAAIDDLLGAIAITRQFFKTLSLQQDFARLSRVVAYSGLVALVASIAMALVYRPDSVTVPAQYLPLVFSLGIGVIVTPLAVFIAYVFRAATIARQTASVGPFVPPEERSESG